MKMPPVQFAWHATAFLIVLMAALALAASGSAFGQDASPAGIKIFPQQRLFPMLAADGIAHQLALSKDFHSRRWIGAIGGLQRLLQLTTSGPTVQVSLGATVYASLIKKPKVLEVVTADFYVDIPIDVQLTERLVLRTGYGHYSAHLADDGIELLGLSSVNYAKDYVPLLACFRLPEAGGYVYGGTRFDYYTIPERGRHWQPQFGGEFGNFEALSGIRAYLAIDVKLKSEVAWATTQSFQIGVRLLEGSGHTLRIAYTYRTGIDDRGQFYRQRVSLSLAGVYLDL